MYFEAFSIQEFLGILLIGFPILIFISFVIIDFIGQIREIFEKQKSVFHHHFHYRDPKQYDRSRDFR